MKNSTTFNNILALGKVIIVGYNAQFLTIFQFSMDNKTRKVPKENQKQFAPGGYKK